MNIAIISVTESGQELSEKIYRILCNEHSVSCYCYYKYANKNSEIFYSVTELVKNIFNGSDGIIFISSCGIAVRSIAPYVNSKLTDPAVIVIDSCGNFVIPILSGHIGGANRLSEIIAEKINAAAVITTATDIGRKFSPDSFAIANGLIISDMKAAKEIAAAVLNDEKISLISDQPCINVPIGISENISCRTGIIISDKIPDKKFEVTLQLIPKNIVLGIGCKKGTSSDSIEKFVRQTFDEYNLLFDRIFAAASIDIKSDENGINEFCEKYRLEKHFYSAEELMNVKGNFRSSEFVMQTTGADNICERSAVLCSGGRIVIPKASANGITVSAAEKPVIIDFERKIL